MQDTEDDCNEWQDEIGKDHVFMPIETGGIERRDMCGTWPHCVGVDDRVEGLEDRFDRDVEEPEEWMMKEPQK